MKFELYAKHIYQEFPTHEIETDNWTGRWTKSDTYGKYCPCKGGVAMVPEDLVRYPLRFLRVFLRAEEFGGLLYDPTTTAIYRLDTEAFALVNRLLAYLKKHGVEEAPNLAASLAKQLAVPVSQMSEILTVLKEVNLWSR